MNSIRVGFRGLAIFSVAYLFTPISMAITIDGSITGDNYGLPLSIQTVQTQFGNDDGIDKGSELDAAYGHTNGSKLFLTLTGNLEDNFNKLVLFIDSQAGGQNALDTDTFNGGINPVFDPSPFPSDPGMFAKMNSFFGGPSTFDNGFLADYVLVIRHGFTGSENRLDFDYGVLGGGASSYLGVLDPTIANSGNTGTGANSSPINIGFDNSNIAGIDGGTGSANQAAAASVSTGIELGIDLADLGNPSFGDEIKITAFITNSNHDYVSNQFLGGLPDGVDNLGSDGFGSFFPQETYFDLNNFAGNQYFTITVVPEPTAAWLFALASISLLARRVH